MNYIPTSSRRQPACSCPVRARVPDNTKPVLFLILSQCRRGLRYRNRLRPSCRSARHHAVQRRAIIRVLHLARICTCPITTSLRLSGFGDLRVACDLSRRCAGGSRCRGTTHDAQGPRRVGLQAVTCNGFNMLSCNAPVVMQWRVICHVNDKPSLKQRHVTRVKLQPTQATAPRTPTHARTVSCGRCAH